MRKALLPLLLVGLTPALAQDDDAGGGLSLTDTDIDIDLSAESKTVTFTGDFGQKSTRLSPGASVQVYHPGGNVTVRCTDTEEIVSRITYAVDASEEAAAEAFGTGIKMSTSAWSGGSRGRVKVVMPYKSSKIKRYNADLVVSVPQDTNLDIDTPNGWLQAQGCEGNVDASAGKDGAYVDGDLEGFQVSARSGDIKVVVHDGAGLSRSSSVRASSGNAELVLPNEVDLRLSARGTEVAIDRPVDGDKSSTSINGNLGEGGTSVSVTASGNVNIRTQ